ncbi:MAG: glycosyltransferase family 2 protein [Verrucomicrobia bacterium]|nr:glycosyltransferase family 2 protein [Verrucomicrobiota bacterium]
MNPLHLSPRSVTVLIVNWKSKDYVRASLRSLHEHAMELVKEVIVVDGASFDGCREMLLAEFPDTIFIQSEQNLGFGKCNNLGAKSATGDWLLLLNPDTVLRPGSLQTLAGAMEQCPDAGILGPKLLNTDGSLQTSCVQAFPTPINQALDSDWLRLRLPGAKLWDTQRAFTSRTPVEVQAVSGACMLLRTEVFRRIGGFSPEYFMYGEDMDLCAKVKKLGLRNYHVPASEIVHHGGGSSTGSFSKISAVLLRQSVHLFIHRHQGSFAAAGYRILMAVSAALRVCLLAGSSWWSPDPIRTERLRSLKKWKAVLSWSAGMESRLIRSFS